MKKAIFIIFMGLPGTVFPMGRAFISRLSQAKQLFTSFTKRSFYGQMRPVKLFHTPSSTFSFTPYRAAKLPNNMGLAPVLGAVLLSTQNGDAQEGETLEERAKRLIRGYSSHNFNFKDKASREEVLTCLFELCDDIHGAMLIADIIKYEINFSNYLLKLVGLKKRDLIADMVDKIKGNPLAFVLKAYSDYVIEALWKVSRFELFDLSSINEAAVISQFASLTETKLGIELLKAFQKKHSSFKVADFFGEAPEAVIWLSKCNEKTQDKICSSWHDFLDDKKRLNNNLLALIHDCLGHKTKWDYLPKLSKLPQTTTLVHLKENHSGIKRPDYKDLNSVLEDIVKKEYELQGQGYYTFVNGHRWSYRFTQRLYKCLYEAEHGQLADDFIFLHARPTQGHQVEKEKRTQLLKYGRQSDADRGHLLFMNYALFGNDWNSGSNSVRFAFENSNIGKIYSSSKDIFRWFGYEDIYNNYADELKELEQEHSESSEYGQLVLIAVPKKQLAECVYYTQSGGPRLSVVINGKEETSDIQKIMDTLHTRPSQVRDKRWGSNHHFEFVLIMTQDEKGGLNPSSGIKMFGFNAADPEKLAEYTKKEQELFTKIKRDIFEKEKRRKVNNEEKPDFI